jgi:hypothetical protein
MRVVDIRRIPREGGARVTGTVIWEDRDHPSQELFFECRGPASEDMSPNPDAFLLACAMPALEFGERRVQVEGDACPELRNGLITAFSVIRGWFPGFRAPAIEATEGFRARTPRTPQRVALFWSGGIDGLTSLRTNRLDYPLDHPASIRDGLYIHGLTRHDFVDGEPVKDRLTDFEARVARMEGLAEQSGVDLIPVYANVRSLLEDYQPWGKRGIGAGIVSVAHVFPSRITRALTSSTGRTDAGSPKGYHPLLEPNYSSSAVEVRHDGLRLSRIEKTAFIAEWDAALAVLQCCLQPEVTGKINCGRCAKCIRTMVQLAALGKLENTDTFNSRVLTPQMILDAAPVTTSYDAAYLECTIELFESRGRHDLAEAVRRRVAHYHEMVQRPRWREAIAVWDRRWTGGILARKFGHLGRKAIG